jgi:hypothetical protein
MGGYTSRWLRKEKLGKSVIAPIPFFLLRKTKIEASTIFPKTVPNH